MKRTLVNLDPDDKTWLDLEAKARHVPMTELVREAVRSYRVREQSRGSDRLQQMVRETAGIGRRPSGQTHDGLTQQQRLRDEWDRGGGE